jgi:hypothetical protein
MRMLQNPYKFSKSDEVKRLTTKQIQCIEETNISVG